MNFSWNTNQNNVNKVNNNVNLIDVYSEYRNLTEGFCNYYYDLFDNNFPDLSGLFKNDCMITYLDEEMSGFNEYFSKIKQYNIYNFTHHEINVNSQPVGSSGLLITTTGTISINNSIFRNKFSETILLVRDDQNNFFIHHYMFRLID